MKTRHLTRRGDVYVFQIRIPKQLNQNHLSPIRISLGPIGHKVAQGRADILAGLARGVFQRRRKAMNQDDRKRIIDGLSFEQKLMSVSPSLGSLDVILEGNLGDDIGTEIRNAAMSGLGALGLDRAIGQSFVAEVMGERLQSALTLALTDDAFARSFFNLPAKEVAGLSPDDRMARILELLEERALPTLEQLVRTDAAADRPTAVGSTNKVRLFSEATVRFINTMNGISSDTKTADERTTTPHADSGAVARASKYFISLQGDRKVTDYTVSDLQDFANDLSYVQSNIGKKPIKISGTTIYGDDDFDLKKHVKAQRDRAADIFYDRIEPETCEPPTLSENTIRHTYLDRVKRIIDSEYTAQKIPNPLRGVAIKINNRAAPPRARDSLSVEAANEIFRAGVKTGIMADIMLPLLAWITGRRLGLLVSIQTDWIKQEHGAWVVKPKWIVDPNNRAKRVARKTSPSLKKFALHRYLEDIGFIDWVKAQEPGPVFRILNNCKRPEAAGQKRMSRLLDSTGVLDKGELETFHSLRNTWISSNTTKLEDRVSHLQAGHELKGDHPNYKKFLQPEEIRILYDLPLPDGFDPTVFLGIDWEAASKRVPRGGRRAKKTVRLPANRQTRL